nr:class I SAM-dependent methyltransferase [Planosporangium thailandense]
MDRLLPESAAVLDLGCGCGVPVARLLTRAGHTVTGADISEVQIRRARRLVPDATFVCADATELDFPLATFDAVVCFYALIHMPLTAQPDLIRRIAGWLRPGGWLVATVGDTAWTGREENWLGGPATMWWSQADASTYRMWLHQAELSVEAQERIPEGTSAHTLFWAQRPPAL